MKIMAMMMEAITICGLEPKTMGIGPMKITPPILALPIKLDCMIDADIQSKPKIIKAEPSVRLIHK
jgi:hypothetical protein